MANEENLRPFNTLTESERRALAKKAGIASGEARRERKTLREELLILLADSNTQEKVSVALIQQALQGNVKAFEVLRDTIGEKPVEQQQVDMSATITVDYGDND